MDHAPVAPRIDARQLSADQQNRVLIQMEILARFEREADDLFAPAEEPARYVGPKTNPVSGPCQERIVAGVVTDRPEDLALGRLSLLEQNLAERSGRDIENFDALESILQAGHGEW